MENNSQAIEIKGIVRNQTKIGVQDGQCDDLVNLRFKDGSWRVADDGKMIVNSAGTPFSVYPYTQLYVHTNVYHHLLGVTGGKLWWFANIDADNETFSYVTDNEGDPDAIEICDVQGDVTIVQNGHLLTIISLGSSVTTPLPLATSSQSEERISYAIFVTGTDEYKVLNVNANGEQTDRGLYPFGRVHFNLDCDSKDFTHQNNDAGEILIDLENPGESWSTTLNHADSGALVPKTDESETHAAAQLWHASMLDVFNQAKEENYFTDPFLAIVAVRLYDESYVYTSAPVLLSPREKYSTYKLYFDELQNKDIDTGDAGLYYQKNMASSISDEVELTGAGYDQKIQVKKFKVYDKARLLFQGNSKTTTGGITKLPFYYSGSYGMKVHVNTENDSSLTTQLATKCDLPKSKPLTSVVHGASILLTLGNINSIIDNSDILKGISIFITKPANIYKMGAADYKYGEVKYFSTGERRDNADGATASYTLVGNVMYKPAIREDREIVYDLIHSPFYLLRDYSINDLRTMANTTIKVDLNNVEYKGLLSNIEQQETLPSEALGRSDFIPQVAYQYNQKLHIANYQSKQFHGFPIDCFQFSNHNLKISNGNYAIGGVLPNVEEGADFQYTRDKFYFIGDITDVQQYVDKALEYGYFFAAITVSLETSQGEQKVVRYIKPYRADEFKDGDQSNFIESLSPLITFPDSRAKKMTISFVRAASESSILLKTATYQLTPHPYLNLAYYIKSDLKPLSAFATRGTNLESFLSGEYSNYYTPDTEQNNTEVYPNGLKVSVVNNPFTFPYENTYQVGSSEIVALMSNTVAVGTGQTGDAPLYVFCKDGIYILIVDPSGTMTYTNQPPIARDVCNNAKSVTPIDNGVVFTSDRGLMSIAGDKVIEIGSAAEGDVFDITDTSDKAKKIMFNAFTMQQLAEFPQSLVDNTDFLTYLKGAIINYNHNERELMVSNPNKDYTYVMDRNGNWSRRAFTAQEYVNNYPTSYRIDKSGKLYKVDADDNDTNKVYLLSNVIKLGTIAFKQAYRLVVRGYFETSSVAYGEINGVDVKVVGSFIDRMKGGEGLHMTYITQYGQPMWVDTNNNNYVLNGQIQILDKETNEDITNSAVQVNLGQYYQVVKSYETVGCYVFGSYDGRQWALLGGNEKDQTYNQGKFTDIGCKISHTDIRFLRVCLAGKLSKDTRIDYIEVSADGSALNGKLR